MSFSCSSSITHLGGPENDHEADDATLHSSSNLPGSLAKFKPQPPPLFSQETGLSDLKTAPPDEWLSDPRNPRNWSNGRKWSIVSIVSFYMFVSPLSSSIMSPGLSEIAAKFNIDNETILAMTLSIFLLSFGIGPLFLAPLSEMYGRRVFFFLSIDWPRLINHVAAIFRRWILHAGNMFSIVFHLGCAFAPNTATLLVFRFLAGFSGSAPVACGGAVVSDLFSERERASAMALFNVGPLLGPVVGPIAGGFIAQLVGVQYVYFVLAGVTALAGLIGVPFLKETYGPLVKLRVTPHPTDPEKTPQLADGVHSLPKKINFLWTNFSRPLHLLTHSFICFTLSLYMAFMYGLVYAPLADEGALISPSFLCDRIYYLFFATLNAFFRKTYGFSIETCGLMYGGLGAGFMLAAFCNARYSNVFYKYLADKNGGVGEPEMRIPPMFIGSVFVPLGLLWYGWSAQAKLHWIMPVIGSGIFGYGMMTTFLPIQLYLVDSFKYAASALSAAFLFRSMLGFSFPLFGHAMFTKMGFGWGNTLLGGIAILLGFPFPAYIYYRGAALRATSGLNH
ncbi:unnamed protein product [Mycena citricolor]|uniref:Major facilitator superfamily (MFS) profile domain-containing protein n=1 Tax=Mycena citricolor TaxID=2018698 RepID=A0AAD2HGM8_9AGAR|nr:unnamed protein product [Mycena citricolor]